MAICRLLSLVYAATGNFAPLLTRRITLSRSFCATVNCTVVGRMVVITTMPGELEAVTKLPGSTRRSPTRPATGEVMCAYVRSRRNCAAFASSVLAWASACCTANSWSVTVCSAIAFCDRSCW